VEIPTAKVPAARRIPVFFFLDFFAQFHKINSYLIDWGAILTAKIDQIKDFSIPHRIVPAIRRADLFNRIRSDHERGALSDDIFRNYARIFDCPPPTGFSAGSLIVGAVAQPRSRIPFAWRDRRFFLRVPPSYIRYWNMVRRLEQDLNGLLRPAGFQAQFARVPQKALAVLSGLALYGRNNIAYVPGLGSYHMLVSYYSDRPAIVDGQWAEPRQMDRCGQCQACLKACPTGAIRPKAFPIRQDLCLTFYAGYSGPRELPSWLDPGLIDGLIGCEVCQAACPENRLFLSSEIEEEGFSADETGILLANGSPESIPPALMAKLERLGLVEFFGRRECLQMMASKLALFIPRVESGAIPSEDDALKGRPHRA